ncbi:hypothetical protein [Arcticibacterium luteifluviistationis]|uniref:Uncharacterized protein n=1 Tax=Arcticibacterium luteifluviistationis TaxID=1784714 RepID=A0A2Z4GBL5_9BACT|nr:hypothetical protein [Arcticibacterium luteifluviistationis]AWV98440.1 hypothetical protein DJ013_09740 [Arcticibacterium luteifluviistationis]
MSVEDKKQNNDNSKDTFDDYFKSLEESILSKALGDTFHLPLDVKHPFVAPEGYFEALEATIVVNTLNNASYQLEANIAHPFTAPEEYFNTLEHNVFSATTEISSLQENIGHPFVAPVGYFDQLDEQIYSKTTDKVTESNSPFKMIWQNYGNIIRVAATLILVGFLGLSIYNNKEATASSEELTLAELNTESIYAYLQEENLSLDDFNTLDNAFEDTAFDVTNTTDTEELSEEELLQLIDFQFTDEI